MNNLPLEIEESIVSFMDYKTLGRYTSVSKSQSVWIEKMEKEKIAVHIEKYRSIEMIYGDMENRCDLVMVFVDRHYAMKQVNWSLQWFYTIIQEILIPSEMIQSQNIELKQSFNMAINSYTRAMKKLSQLEQKYKELGI